MKKIANVSNSFLSDPGIPGVRSMGPDVTERPFADKMQNFHTYLKRIRPTVFMAIPS